MRRVRRCHIASGSFIDEGRDEERCQPDDRRCTRGKPRGMDRTAEHICQHLKFMNGGGFGARTAPAVFPCARVPRSRACARVALS